MESTYTKIEIALADAAEGMQLAESVVDVAGKVLMPSDVLLTAPLIASLKQLGITRLSVLKSVDQLQQQEVLAKALTRLDQLFRHSGNNSANRRLHASLRQHHIRRLYETADT